MLQCVRTFFLFILMGVCYSIPLMGKKCFISLHQGALRECCFNCLEDASNKALEDGKQLMVTVYQTGDPLITDLFTGGEEKLLFRLSRHFVFYTLEISRGLMPVCSEKTVLLEKMKISRLPTVTIVDPKTFSTNPVIERPKGKHLTESIFRKGLEKLLEDHSS